MTYQLLAYCNRRNAEELAKPREARALGTLDWVAPTNMFYAAVMATFPLGRGHKISCGSSVLEPDEYDVREFGAAALSRNGYNVCRPFDELSATSNELNREWNRLRWCEWLSDERGWPIADMDELSRLNPFNPLYDRNFKAIIPQQLDAWIQFSTPPNHGHDAACVCAKWSARLLPNLPDPKHNRISVQLDHDCRVVLAVSKAEAIKQQAQALQFRTGNVELPWPKHTECPYELIAKPKGNCKWCEGTGRVVYDQDGRGNQAQHRVSKPMAKEWNRYELFWNARLAAHEWRLRRKAAIR